MSTAYVCYEKPKNAEKISNDISERITSNKLDLFFIEKVFAVVKKWDNKKITKRIISDLEKDPELSGWNVVYNTRYGMYHIDIFKQGGHSFSALICYDSWPIVSFGNVQEYNRCHTLNKERNERLEHAKPLVKSLTDRWNAAIEEIKAINAEAAKYELEYVFEIDRNNK